MKLFTSNLLIIFIVIVVGCDNNGTTKRNSSSINNRTITDSSIADSLRSSDECIYILKNVSYDEILLQVFLGDDNDCELNLPQEIVLLKYNQSQSYTSNEDCCYRYSIDDGQSWTDDRGMGHCTESGGVKEKDL